MKLSEPSQWDIQPNGVNITARHRITGHTFSGTRDTFNDYLNTYQIPNNWNENVLAIGTIIESPTAPSNGTWLECNAKSYLKSEFPAMVQPGDYALEGTRANIDASPYFILEMPNGKYLMGFWNQGGYNGLYVVDDLNDIPNTSVNTSTVSAPLRCAMSTTGTIIVQSYYLDANAIQVSTDNGLTWTGVANPMAEQMVVLEYLPAADLFVIGPSISRDPHNHIYTSPDGLTWTEHVLPSVGFLIDITSFDLHGDIVSTIRWESDNVSLMYFVEPTFSAFYPYSDSSSGFPLWKSNNVNFMINYNLTPSQIFAFIDLTTSLAVFKNFPYLNIPVFSYNCNQVNSEHSFICTSGSDTIIEYRDGGFKAHRLSDDLIAEGLYSPSYFLNPTNGIGAVNYSLTNYIEYTQIDDVLLISLNYDKFSVPLLLANEQNNKVWIKAAH